MRKMMYILSITIIACLALCKMDSVRTDDVAKETVFNIVADPNEGIISDEATLTAPPRIPAADRSQNSLFSRSLTNIKRATDSFNRQQLIALATDISSFNLFNRVKSVNDRKTNRRPCDYYVFGLCKLIC